MPFGTERRCTGVETSRGRFRPYVEPHSGADRLRELRRHALVGVDRQDPVALRERERVVLVRPEPLPAVRRDARDSRLL